MGIKFFTDWIDFILYECSIGGMSIASYVLIALLTTIFHICRHIIK